MSEHDEPLSDAMIEAALRRRATGHADPAFLGEIVSAAAATRQVRRGPVSAAVGRRPVLLAAAAALLLVAGTLAFSGGSHPPMVPSPAASLPAAVVGPSVSPEQTASADPDAASPSAVTCATQTTSVLTGNAMPPANAAPMTVAAGVLRVGVYLTEPIQGSTGGQTDVWSITAGNALRIASIVGPDLNIAQVDDISADGRVALIDIGVLHVTQLGPSCADLYAVRTDGSGAIRVTFNGPDAWATDGTFSHDGRYVAFRSDTLDSAAPSIGLIDLQGDATADHFLCDISTTDLHLAWSPADDRLAAVCGNLVEVVSVSGAPSPLTWAVSSFVAPTGDNGYIGIGWQDPERVLLVTAVPGEQGYGPIQLDAVTLGSRASAQFGTWSPTVTIHPWLADPGLSTGAPVAPDGHAVALFGDTATNDPQGDTLSLYTMDAGSGKAQRIAPWGASDPGWSSDSRSLVFIDHDGDTPVLTIYDLDTKTGHRYGSMPLEYQGGIWRAS